VVAPILTLNGDTTVTISAGQTYDKCTSTVCAGCDCGMLPPWGDKAIACMDGGGSVSVGIHVTTPESTCAQQ
jgi:hypothetical protein